MQGMIYSVITSFAHAHAHAYAHTYFWLLYPNTLNISSNGKRSPIRCVYFKFKI